MTCVQFPHPQIRYSLRWNRLYLFTQHREKKQIRDTVRCVDASPTYNDYQQYNTQREKQVLGKWFNIEDRSKKPHHTITYVTKISLTVSTTRLCSQWGQKNQKKLWSKQQKSKPLKFLTNTFIHLKWLSTSKSNYLIV